MNTFERYRHLSGRIEALREAAHYQRQSRASIGTSTDWEEAARRYAVAELAMTDWFTEALRETLTEARLILQEMKAQGLVATDVQLDDEP